MRHGRDGLDFTAPAEIPVAVAASIDEGVTPMTFQFLAVRIRNFPAQRVLVGVVTIRHGLWHRGQLRIAV